MNKQLIVIITLIVIGIFVFYTKLYRRKEPFTSSGDSMAAAAAFADDQRTYFYDQADKALYTNMNLKDANINAALASVDVDMPDSRDIDYSNFFVQDPSGIFFEKERAMCSNIDMPKNLPSHEPRARVGCGWYFYSDTNHKSEGKIGTASGPLFENLRGGEWIWDLRVAQEKEETKYCKAIKSCDTGLDSAIGNPLGPCGFCKEKGHAIPIQTNGAIKYANVSCGVPVKKNSAECIELPIVQASDGVACQTFGRPSANASLRLYTQAECETGLKGVYNTANNTCKSKDGIISYSVQCASLNTPIVVFTPCTPVNGKLTTGCLETIAYRMGFTGSGAIIRLLTRNTGPNDNDAVAFEILRKDAGLDIPVEYYRGGAVTVQQIETVYQRIYSLRNNPSSRISTAAKWLSVGGVEMNFCDINGSEKGPFSTVCVQRAFRSAGCQAGGLKYPSERTSVSEYANMTWDQVNKSFAGLYSETRSESPEKQDAALKNCLGTGTQYYREPRAGCYSKSENGYYESSGNECFTQRTLEDVKKACDADSTCTGFSFSHYAAPYGDGCLKKSLNGIFVNSPYYDGYMKPKTT